MKAIATAVVGLVVLTSLAAVSLFRVLLGTVTLTWWGFAAWLVLLTAANLALALAVQRRWKDLSLRAQVLAILWLALSLWYWTVAPLFFFLSMNVNAQQLAWTTFAFVWEVPVIGGGLFITLSLLAFQPFLRVMNEKASKLKHPEAVMRWTLWYPRVVGAILFFVSTIGYALGSLQLRWFAGWDQVEQVKNVVGGAFISLFLAVLLYLVFDMFLGQVRARLKRDYVIGRVVWRRLNTRITWITAVLMVGSVGLFGLVAFDALQYVVSQSQGMVGISVLTTPELISTFAIAAFLVFVLTVGLLVLVGHSLTRALRWLSKGMIEAPKTGKLIKPVRTADELEAVSQIFSDTIEDLSLERNRFREAQTRDEAILQSMGEGLVVADHRGRVLRLNAQAEQLIGWASDQVVGKLWAGVVQLVDDKGQRIEDKDESMVTAIRTGQVVKRRFRTYTGKDGKKFPVSVTAAPLMIGNEAVGAVLMFQDVTKEKMIDQAKTEFVSLASHQLRTPLTAMNWYVELLLRGAGLTREQRSDLEKIRVRGQRMVQLVNDLLNVSRLEAGRLQIDPVPTDLVELINSLVDELLPFAQQRGCQVIFHKSDDEFSQVKVDRNLLRQVIHNLLTNAIKYSRPGQDLRVWVQLERSSREGYIISVQDNGIGIPFERRSRVFDKFFRADNAIHQEPDGTGLGLYVAKKILTSAGGEIWFESIEDRGTTFFVEIPETGMRGGDGVDLARLIDHTEE